METPVQTGDSQRSDIGPRPLATLPAEVLLLVCKHVPRQELKSLRRSCRSLAKIVEPILFEKIVVVPCHQSYQNTTLLAKHPVLGPMVQQLIYDNRWGTLAARLLIRLQDAEATSKKHPLILKYLEQLSEETMSNPDEDVEVAYLSGIFPYLSNLSGITIQDGAGSFGHNDVFSVADMPLVYDRALQMLQKAALSSKIGPVHRSTIRPAGCRAVLLASSHWIKLRRFRCEDLAWEASFTRSQGIRLMRRTFTELETLHVTSTHEPEASMSESAANFAQLIASATKLKKLVLHIASASLLTVYDRNMFGAATLNLILPGTTRFRLLTELHFSGFTAYEGELTSFFERHAKTLRVLSLGRARLIRHMHSGEEAPCWTRVIKALQRLTTLEKFKFTDFLSNSDDQNITMKSDKSPACLKRQIESFVLCGGLYPLDAIMAGDPKLDGTTTGEELYQGDHSWRVTSKIEESSEEENEEFDDYDDYEGLEVPIGLSQSFDGEWHDPDFWEPGHDGDLGWY